MARPNSTVCVWLVCILLMWVSVRVSPAQVGDWKFDRVHLKNGAILQGLVVEQKRDDVLLYCVGRKPGKHTFVIPQTVSRQEIDRLELLDTAERELLTARLKALDPTGKGEAQRMASLELRTVPWGPDGKGRALGYESSYFGLCSSAPEDVVRRVAVRLEQIYAAYARFLPPRNAAAAPTAILLAPTLAEYRTLLRDQGRNLLNPAFFDAERNQIVCGMDLVRLGEGLEQARRDHERLLDDLKGREAELNRLYKNKVPAALLKPIQDARIQVDRQNKQNDEIFQQGTALLFRTLYHEAFHAYLAGFVYPPVECEVPRWLNEGLAQIFEQALVEAGELRVGHVDRTRLTRAQQAVERSELVPLVDLLRAGPKQFVVAHASDQQTSDRHYLTAWALAFHLTMERRLLGSAAMDRYTRALQRGTDPLEAFRELTGESLAGYEKKLHQYVLNLRPDGTVKPK